MFTSIFFKGQNMLNPQKKIECELFEIHNRNLDRFFSSIKFIFVIFGFYTLIFSNVYGQLDIHAFDNVSVLSVYSLLASLLSIGIAVIFPFAQLLMPREQKFKQTKGLIRFREEEELSEYNNRLFLVIQQQDKSHVISFLLILLSLIFYCGYFVPYSIPGSIIFYIMSCVILHHIFRIDEKGNKRIKIVQSLEG